MIAGRFDAIGTSDTGVVIGTDADCTTGDIGVADGKDTGVGPGDNSTVAAGDDTGVVAVGDVG